MTTSSNEEMAIALGRYIIQMQQQMAEMAGIITEFCPDTQARLVRLSEAEKTERAEQENRARRGATAQQDGLRQHIAAEIQDSGLIRVLHDYFLEPNVLEE